MVDTLPATWRARLRRRWRPLLVYGAMALIVGMMLLNVFFDYLVSRYERNAPRDPDSPYLKGMTPRELGPEDASCAVLFVHGFIGAQSNFNTLPDEVAAAGMFVRTMRLPGHGTTPRDFEQTGADALLAGVLAEVRELKAHYPKVVVVGHSLGGALSTLAAAEEPVDGLVLCAPYFDLTWRHVLGIPMGRFVRSLAPILRWAPARPGGGPVNLKESRKLIDYYRWIPTRGGVTALEVGRRARDPEVCGAITAPLLVLHSKIDSVTSQSATARQIPLFASEQKRIIWLETSDHVIFWDHEQALVSSEVLGFIKEVEAL